MTDSEQTPAEHEERIDEVLRNAYQKEYSRGREPVYHRTPLNELVAREEGEPGDEYQIRLEAFSAVLSYIFADGPHPGNVVRRAFALARVQRADLLLNMSLEEIGKMLGETRAAQSWRIQQIFSGYLQAAGMKGFKLSWMKPAEARGKYSESAKGNTNRRGTGALNRPKKTKKKKTLKTK